MTFDAIIDCLNYAIFKEQRPTAKAEGPEEISMPHDRVGGNPQHLGDFLRSHGLAEVFQFHHGAFFA
ncbi:MAG: hypothetical protein ACP59X_02530 [Solidesulfovibrio sp. DCME]|uniref:hypothetical protein n=1 Tax=Solidesulfovibrio sp. DCME TaxID=3447380 RepID=UPI003D0C2E65